MPDKFLKFPRTPHLFSSSPEMLRNDRVCSETERNHFLSHNLVVEEKLDGANIGISVTAEGVIRVQNRGSYLENPLPIQFQPLWPWIDKRRGSLLERLGTNLMVFGEWCFAVHSIRYNRLPDWFLGFDVYDFEARGFWSSDRRNGLLLSLGITPVPQISTGRFDLDWLRRLLISTKSSYGDTFIEGLYLRREDGGWLTGRAKLVRPEFIQAVADHWISRPLEKNVVVR